MNKEINNVNEDEVLRDLGLLSFIKCSGLIAPDTLIRDNNYQRLRCHNESETNVQTIF